MPSYTYADLEPLLPIAERMARGLCRRLRLPADEAEDLRQDLLTDLIARLPGFDPALGTLAAFAMTCFRHRATVLTRRACRERAMRHPTSLDDPLPGGLTVGGALREADGYGAWVGQPTDAIAALERQLDLDRAAQALGEEDVQLCRVLARGETSPARKVGLSRTTAFRRLREMRLRLLAAGVSSAA